MKYTGPVRFIFKGDEKTCLKHTSRARLYLQQAIDRMGSDKASWNRTEPDGTTIRIQSFTSGYNVTIVAGKEEEFEGCISGFLIEPYSDAAPLGFAQDQITPLTAEDIEDGKAPGFTIKDGEIDKKGVDFQGASQAYTLDWTAKEFDGYLVWPATYLKSDTDDNSVEWTPFHRYYCKPENGRLYYCNEDHSGGPGGLPLGYAVRVIGKQRYLYCVATTDGLRLNIHRRVWTIEPYADDDELAPDNVLGWELIGTVTTLADQGWGAYKFSSGAYFNPDADKFVLTLHGSDVDTPRGYIEVEIGDYGVIRADRTYLLDYDLENQTFSEVNSVSDPYPNKGPWNADGEGVYDYGADISWTSCPTYGVPIETFPASGDASWSYFESGVGYTYMTSAHSTTYEYYPTTDVIVGADYDYETGGIKTITQGVYPDPTIGGGAYVTSSGGFTKTEDLVDCQASCGGHWEVNGVYNNKWESWSETEKSYSVYQRYDNSPETCYALSVSGNKTGEPDSNRGSYTTTGNSKAHYFKTYSCGGGPWNGYGPTTTQTSLTTTGLITFEANYLLYLDMRYGTYISVKGEYVTSDAGLNYESAWTYDINGDLQEAHPLNDPLVPINSNDQLPGFVDTLYTGSGDTREWDYSLVPEAGDNLAWHTLGNVFTNKDGELIAQIPSYTIQDSYWQEAVIPDQTNQHEYRLYYSPHGFDALEELGFTQANLKIAKLRLV